MAVTERFEKLAERLATIANEHDGRLTPDAVVEDARDAASPIHKYFEWDDSKAAHQHRLDTARSLIRSVEVKVTTFRRDAPVRAYVRDPEAAANKQGYVPIATAKTDIDFRKETLSMELKRAGWTLERARSHAEFFGLVPQVERLVASLKEIETALKELS